MKSIGNRLGNGPKAKDNIVDPKAIRELAELLTETGLTEIEVEHNGARLRVARHASVSALPAPTAVMAPAQAPAAEVASGKPATPGAGAVPSPMVGTVYLSPEPGAKPFVSVGQAIKEGDTLFIVEAMKTMNPITAPKAGTVREISVTDAQPVEFGQTLCIIT